MLKTFLVFFFVSLLPAALTARAEDSPSGILEGKEAKASPDDFAGLERNPVPERVKVVIDPLTFTGEGGEVYRLAGLDVPGIQEDGLETEISALGKKRLAEILEGKEVRILETKTEGAGRTNRLGHRLVYVVRTEGHVFVQGLLLSEGLARVRTTPANPDMAGALFSREEKARRQGKGIWADKEYRVRREGDTADFFGRFGIVEGKVAGVSVKANTIFINFGKDWQRDITLGIPSSARALFARKGISPQSLSGTYIRARGWVREYYGPYIEIDHPEQIEILKEEGRAEPSLSSPSPPPSSPSEPEVEHQGENPEIRGMRTIRAPIPPRAPTPPEAQKITE